MLNSLDLHNTTHTWLITGVAGFIGSNLLETLLKLNQKVIGLDNFFSGHQCNIDAALRQVPTEKRRNFVFHEGDIRSQTICNNIMPGVDYVLHQAALSSVPKSIECVALTHEINVTGFFNILLAARDAHVKRFVYASSCAVYGNANQLPNNESQIIDVLSPYNASKYIDELYATTFSICYGLETIGLRYFNIYGPRQDAAGPYAAVITRWIDALINKKQTYIHDDHHQSRDFCYVDDVVSANILAATTQNKDAVNTVYNIATGEESDLHTVYDLILKSLKIQDLKPESTKGTQGELDHSRADITKARKLLGYNPVFTVTEGIPKLVSLILENQ